MARSPFAALAIADERTYDGATFASKAEAVRAQELEWLVKSGELCYWESQRPIQLCDAWQYVVDFAIFNEHANMLWCEEIKGTPLPRTAKQKARVRQLYPTLASLKRHWKRYGPCELRILWRKGNGWETEVVEGRQSR